MNFRIILALAGATALFAFGAGALSEEGSPPHAATHPSLQELGEHTPRVFLSPKDAESGAALGLLPQGVHSILNVANPLEHGDFRWDETSVPPGPLLIRVDLDRQLLSVFRAGHEIGTAVVLYGTDRKATPVGRFPIKAKLRDYHSRSYDAPMPFTLWLTESGVAVHGSSVQNGRATNGCVGVPVKFAQHLFEAARVGDEVQIVGTRTHAS